MVRGLPQFAEEHLSSAQKRREEVGRTDLTNLHFKVTAMDTVAPHNE